MDNEQDQNIEDLKDIPKWTQKYAQNRTLPMMVFLGIFMLLFAGIALPSYFGGKALMAGHVFLTAICVIVLIFSMVCTIIASIPKFGNKLTNWITAKIYKKEGSATIPPSETMKKTKWLGYLVAMIFGSCVLASVILGSKGLFPIEYMQPVSALYVVPFTVFLYFWQRPMVSSIALLWPILYAIHAILIVAGAPIVFTDNLTFLNMIIPTAGYGLLSGMIGHLYSRHALKKLKDLTSPQGDAANGS